MVSVVVKGTPQPWMLRNSHQQRTFTLQRGVHFLQDGFIFLDVLKNIKCADGIKFLREWDCPRIHLHQPCVRQSLRSKSQTLDKYLASEDLSFRIFLGDAGKNKTCSTANFKKRTEFGMVLA